METKGLDLEGIPEPIARGLEIVAQMARGLSENPKQHPRQGELPLWPGTVIGPLDRDAIYEEMNDHVA
jgi:hypothetical protein